MVHHTIIDPVPGAGVPGWLGPSVEIDGRYRILEPLGQGGVGMVWVAQHLGLHRKVALKVLQADGKTDPSVIKRFEREAQTLATLSHPNIVAINDFGVWEGSPYIVMELLEGQTLGELLGQDKTLSQERALGITQQLLRALAYAHTRSVIHRDLKPANVFLQALPDHADHVRLLDFGFAKFVGASVAGSAVTDAGIVVGTPSYMAPEVATGATLDARADVYAVGVLLFEMLTGARPFEGEPIAVMRKRLAEDAPTLCATRPDLAFPEWLDRAVARALARHVELRWQSAGELAAALAPPTVAPLARPKAAPSARSSTGAVGLVGALALGGVIAWWAWPGAEATPARDVGGTESAEAESAEAESAEAESAEPEPGPTAPESEDVVAIDDGPPSEPAEPELAEPPPTEIAEPPPTELAEPPPTEIAEPPIAPAPALADPWAGEVPTQLRALQRRTHRPRVPERSDIHDIRTYVQAHRDDVRPVLLLAHAFTRMHWMDEALETYQRALGMSETARGDADALPNLVALASSESTARGASTLLVRTYGSEAIPAIEAGLAAPDLRPEGHDRLVALRTRITASR